MRLIFAGRGLQYKTQVIVLSWEVLSSAIAYAYLWKVIYVFIESNLCDDRFDTINIVFSNVREEETIRSGIACSFEGTFFINKHHSIKYQ